MIRENKTAVRSSSYEVISFSDVLKTWQIGFLIRGVKPSRADTRDGCCGFRCLKDVICSVEVARREAVLQGDICSCFLKVYMYCKRDGICLTDQQPSRD